MEYPMTCPFCNPGADDIVAKNDLCYARWDRYPVSKGHLLVIPFRHTADCFSLTVEEKQSLLTLIDECKEVIEKNFRPAGYNIGVNVGVADGVDDSVGVALGDGVGDGMAEQGLGLRLSMKSPPAGERSSE